MTTQVSPYDKVVDSLHNLELQINTLLNMEDGMSIHIDDPFCSESPIELLETALKDLWYRDGEDGRRTRVYAGVVECSRNVLAQVENINLAKEQLQKSVHEMGYLSPAKKKKFHKDMFDISSWRVGLSSMGIGRINLNHCYRKIPAHHRKVSVISYSWYVNGQSHRTITPEQAEKLLINIQKKKSTEAINTQLRLLGGHPAHIKLVQVQKLSPHLKANLFESNLSKASKTITPPLPIFIPHSQVVVKQEQSSLEESLMSSRKQRNDVSIEEHPFLVSIRVHRKIC